MTTQEVVAEEPEAQRKREEERRPEVPTSTAVKKGTAIRSSEQRASPSKRAQAQGHRTARPFSGYQHGFSNVNHSVHEGRRVEGLKIRTTTVVHDALDADDPARKGTNQGAQRPIRLRCRAVAQEGHRDRQSDGLFMHSLSTNKEPKRKRKPRVTETTTCTAVRYSRPRS